MKCEQPSREGATNDLLGAPRSIFLGAFCGPFFISRQMNQIQHPRVHQKMARTALLTALCVALGYLFLPIPNLEMITLGIFLSGLLMGAYIGALIGFLAEAIYSLTNPMGFPPPPLLIAQVVSMACVGCAGGLAGALFTPPYPRFAQRWLRHLTLALFGATLTFIFDLTTNLSFPITAGFTSQQILASLALGIPFAIIHIGTNAIAFPVLVPIIMGRLASWSKT